MPTGIRASTTSFQNGSNSGRAGERGPMNPGTGAGRMRTIFAPRSSTHSSSSMAWSTMPRWMTGVGKIRFS